MKERQRDENLMIVVAVEQYAHAYNISTHTAYRIFVQYDITQLIRKHYKALHTQPLDESFYFADDILKRKCHAEPD